MWEHFYFKIIKCLKTYRQKFYFKKVYSWQSWYSIFQNYYLLEKKMIIFIITRRRRSKNRRRRRNNNNNYNNNNILKLKTKEKKPGNSFLNCKYGNVLSIAIIWRCIPTNKTDKIRQRYKIIALVCITLKDNHLKNRRNEE